MDSREVLEVIGVGIGPFNLGLAALLEETEYSYKCFDQKSQFNWHPGMLLEGTTLQVPFMADLVTMVNPSSPYSFLRYLHEHERLYQFYFFEKFHIPRTEYNHYCQWVANQLKGLQFNSKVQKIEIEKEQLYKVTVEESGKPTVYYAKNVVVGVGTNPAVPADFKSLQSNQFYHSACYKQNRDETVKARHITVVGSGQSAAEVVYDLLQHQQENNYELHWYTRSKGFYPMEYSKLGLEHFSPEYTRYFYHLNQDKKREVLKNQALLYKGISFDTIADIYEHLYERTVGGKASPIHMQALTEVQDVCREETDYTLTLYQYEQGQTKELKSDVVIMATGYISSFPSCLESLQSHLLFDENGQLQIDEQFKVRTQSVEANLFIQNGELHTHGVGAPDLGLGAYRNAVIINQIAGKQVYKVYSKNVFQQFGV